MSELEFVGKMQPKPRISFKDEEKMRIDEIKRKIQKEKSKKLPTESQVIELTYERDEY